MPAATLPVAVALKTETAPAPASACSPEGSLLAGAPPSTPAGGEPDGTSSVERALTKGREVTQSMTLTYAIRMEPRRL